MDKQQTLAFLRDVQAGNLSPESMLQKLQCAPFEDLGYAKVDHHRGLRQGTPEVVFGAGKTPQQIIGIAKSMAAAGTRNILVTRLSAEAAQQINAEIAIEYNPVARLGIINSHPSPTLLGNIVLASAGTSDMPVCEEAAITAEVFGSKVTRLYDVGVSGLHRLLAKMDVLSSARVIIVVAGMEGALASVVGGLVSCPIIAVPTSVGYGASFQGMAALLSMLNSCASGVSVVNIDNGFGAGYLANMINQMEGLPNENALP